MEVKDLDPHQQSLDGFMRLVDAEEDARLESLETRELPSAMAELELLEEFVRLENELVDPYMAHEEKEMVKAKRLVLRNQWTVWLDEVQGLLRTSAARDRVWPKFEKKAGMAHAASNGQLPRRST